MFFNRILLFAIFLLFNLYETNATTTKNDKFYEELFIETLQNSDLNYHFQFTILSEQNLNDDSAFTHYKLFPKTIGDIIKKFNINELHLTQTQGRWYYNLWGEPTAQNVPSGLELYVWYNDMGNHSESVYNDLWSKTVRSLASLTCTSMNTNHLNVEPKYSLRPTGLLLYNQSSTLNNKRLKYVSVPNEILCTENLTPFIKLLPCDKHSGLTQLLTYPTHLFDTKFNSIGLHFRHVCLDGDACTRIGIELKLTLSLIIDAQRHMNNNLISASFASVFGRTLTSTCPVADKSFVYVDSAHLAENDRFSVEPRPTETLNKFYAKRNLHVFDLQESLKENKNLNVKLNFERKTKRPHYQLLNVHRYATDTNQFNVGFKTVIENPFDKDVKIVYFENMPWYFRVYLHTLQITNVNTNEKINPIAINYVAALDRVRPHNIEVVFSIKAKSTIHLSLKFENAFLKFTEFPPDAQHGHALNAALVSYKLDNSPLYNTQYRNYYNYSSIYDSLKTSHKNIENLKQVYTEVLLVNLPAPDFSMPYNVICLTCTVIAICFGYLHNFTTKRFKFLETSSNLNRIVAYFKAKKRN